MLEFIILAAFIGLISIPGLAMIAGGLALIVGAIEKIRQR
jgi:hypothetical protein